MCTTTQLEKRGVQLMYTQLIDNALAAGREAGMRSDEQIQERDACGFGWVIIRPARGALVNTLKTRKLGMKSSEGGWRVSSNQIFPDFYGQSVTVKYNAAAAFAQVLCDAGFDATAFDRLD